ncbi:hypothetical protein TWF506_000215 [Arthrobotrys conoides]|uniref:Peptidase A1 domain-containing protein n=1 Tax=Arthrobotrys conoides TaxID=74498 RepID=A0AAN8P7V0_9PEZI
MDREGWVGLEVRYKYKISGAVDDNVYTDVFLGEDRQRVELAVTSQQVTWVPQLPDSRNRTADVCDSGTDGDGCAVEGSGYYNPPANVSRDDTFRFQSGSNSTAQGYWTSTTLSTSTISVNHTFGVATTVQNLTPILGLGISSINRSKDHPSYLDSLLRQNKIFGRYVSFYDVSNPGGSRSGEIVIGGVDTEKYLGRLKRLKGAGMVGVVKSPEVMVKTGREEKFGVGGAGGSAFLTIDTSFLWLPQPIIYNIISTFPVATFDLRPAGSSFVVYTVPCDTKLSPSWVIQFTFEGVVINVPFNHLVTPIEVSTNGGSGMGKRCVLAVQPNDGRYALEGYEVSYVLGAPFWRSAYIVLNPQENMTAIAVPNLNSISRSIVPLGGPFGTEIENIEGTSNSPSNPPSPTPNLQQSQRSKNPSTGVIVGASIAGVIALILIYLGFLSFKKRRKKKRRKKKRRERREGCAVMEWDRVELPGGGYGAEEGYLRRDERFEDVKKRRSEEVPLEGRVELDSYNLRDLREGMYELPAPMRNSMHIGVAS